MLLSTQKVLNMFLVEGASLSTNSNLQGLLHQIPQPQCPAKAVQAQKG